MERLKSDDAENEELASELFDIILISVECTLQPDVAEILTDTIRNQIEDTTGVQFIKENRITGKWHQICKALHSTFQAVASSKLDSENAHAGNANDARCHGMQVSHVSETGRDPNKMQRGEVEGEANATVNGDYSDSTSKRLEGDRKQIREGEHSESLSANELRVGGDRRKGKYTDSTSDKMEGDKGETTAAKMEDERNETRKGSSYSDSTSEVVEGERNEIRKGIYSDSTSKAVEGERNETRKSMYSDSTSKTVEGDRSETRKSSSYRDSTSKTVKGDRNETRKGIYSDSTSKAVEGERNETRKSTYSDPTSKAVEGDRNETRKGTYSDPTSKTVEGDRSETRKGTHSHSTSKAVEGERNETRNGTYSYSTSKAVEGERNETRKGTYSYSTSKAVEGERNETRKSTYSDPTSKAVEGDRSETRKGTYSDSTSKTVEGDRNETRKSTYSDPTSKTVEGDRSETRKGTYSDSTSKTVGGDRSETRKGTYSDSTSKTVEGDRNETRKSTYSDPTSKTVEGDRSETRKGTYSDSTSKTVGGDRSETRKRSIDDLGSENVEGKRGRISLDDRDLDKPKQQTAETRQDEHNDGTKPKQHNDNSKSGHVTLGSCQHQNCTKSKAQKFSKLIMEFIVKYLCKKVEDELKDHRLFVDFDITGESASVQCCGEEVDDAQSRMEIFKLFYGEIEEDLWCGELQDHEDHKVHDQHLPAGTKCITRRNSTNKLLVVCEKQQKDEVCDIITKLNGTETDDGSGTPSAAASHNSTSAAEMPRAPQNHEALKPDSEGATHSVMMSLGNPYYWSHITLSDEVFITELDKMLSEKQVTVHEDQGRLELKGASVSNVKHIEALINKHYSLLSCSLKTVEIQLDSFHSKILRETYPHITVNLDNAGRAVLVGECKDIDRFITESGITVPKPEPREMEGATKPANNASPPSDMATEYTLPCAFLINNSTEVFIHKTDITKLHVDAIVNAANDQLSHGAGVAKAIADAAGPEMDKEGGEIIKRSGPIDVSKTVITSAGRLPCKAVIHAVGPRWPSRPDEKKIKRCLKLLHDTFQNVILTADERCFTSLAMPPISSGNFGVPRDEVARIMCDALTSVRTKKLKEIHLVDITEDLLLKIGSNFLKLNKQTARDDLPSVIELSQDVASSKIQECKERKYRQLVIHNRVKTFIHLGDITKIKADAIICSNDRDLSCSFELAKTIADLAGTKYKQSCKQSAKSKKIQPSDVVSVDGGHLGIIINAVTPLKKSYLGMVTNYGDNSFKELLCETFYNAIVEAKKQHAHCLVMSPLGADQKDVPKQWVAELMCRALIDGLRMDKEIHEVHIVDKNPEILKLIRNELENQSLYVKGADDPEINLQPGDSAGSSDLAMKSSSSNNSSTVNKHNGSDVDPPLLSNASKAVDNEDDKPVVFSSSFRKNRKVPTKHDSSEMLSAASTMKTTATSNNKDEKQEPEICVICMGDLVNPKQLSKCKHKFCKSCIDESFQKCGPKCPSCGELYGALKGNQPKGGRMNVRRERYLHIPGYPNAGTIVIDYYIPDGRQGPEHPNPGYFYTGTSRTAYLPDTDEGNKVLKLLRKAFDARLIFTVGRSSTTGCDNTVVWNDIHHKTSISGGSQNYGYPDTTYLKRVQEELASKGIK